MHGENYSKEGEEGGGSSRSTWLLVFGGLVLALGARITAKPSYVLMSRQLAEWSIWGNISPNREFLGRDAGSAGTCLWERCGVPQHLVFVPTSLRLRTFPSTVRWSAPRPLVRYRYIYALWASFVFLPVIWVCYFFNCEFLCLCYWTSLWGQCQVEQ